MISIFSLFLSFQLWNFADNYSVESAVLLDKITWCVSAAIVENVGFIPSMFISILTSLTLKLAVTDEFWDAVIELILLIWEQLIWGKFFPKEYLPFPLKDILFFE